MSRDELLNVAEEAARAASGVLMDHYRRSGLEVDAKGENDPVTEADRAAETAVVDLIHHRFPTHAIIAEEGGGRPGGGEWEWIVDPLDGTNNFLQGLPVFCTSIACCHRGEMEVAAVTAPALGESFTAVRGGGTRWNGEPVRVSARPGLDGAFLATGFPFHARAAVDDYLDAFRAVFLRCRAIRRCGSAALDLAYTAVGVFDGFFEYRLSAWDIAAGVLMVEEAGGVASDLDGGDDYLESGNVVAGSPGVWGQLVELVASFADEEDLDRLVPLGEAVSC